MKHLLEEENAYKMKKEELEKTLLEVKVVMKTMKRSVLDLKRTLNSLETENERRACFCSSQTATSGSRVMDKLLKHILLV